MEVVIVVGIEQARMYNIYTNMRLKLQIRFPEDDAGVSKHVGVFTIYIYGLVPVAAQTKV
jgi:hypothetical protein